MHNFKINTFLETFPDHLILQCALSLGKSVVTDTVSLAGG